MKIYCPPDNHKLAKVLFAGHLYGRTLSHEPITYGYKNKQFQEHHSLFSIPTLQNQNGEFFFGVHSVLRAIASKPASPFEEAQINQWFELVERDLEPSVGVLILKVNGLIEVKEEQAQKAREMVMKVMKIVDQRLKTNTFLVGDRLTIADITVFFSWNEVNSTLEKEGKQLSSLLRWAKQLSSIPYK